MYRTFAEEFRAAIKEVKLSQTGLSIKTGIQRRYISNYINGYTVPNENNRKQIAIALGKPEDFFEECVKKQKVKKTGKKEKLIGTEGCKWDSWGGIGRSRI